VAMHRECEVPDTHSITFMPFVFLLSWFVVLLCLEPVVVVRLRCVRYCVLLVRSTDKKEDSIARGDGADHGRTRVS